MSDAATDTEAATQAETNEASHTHIRTCPLCEATCGLELTVKGGEVTRVRGDRNDVFSKGFICPKGSVLQHLHNDPDRLRTPLIRENGAFREATWEEAFELITDKISELREQHGPNSIGLYLGNPNAHTFAGAVFNPALIKALGSQNLFSASTLDQMPKHVSCGYMFGSPGSIPVPDLDRTDYLLILGANPLESNGSLCTAPDFPGKMKAIIERGGEIVTVDPRRTKTAAASTEHLPIRPGTDAHWLAALVTEISTIGDDRTSFVSDHLRNHISGLGEALDALAPFTADSVAQRCRIDAETTRRIAASLCEHDRSAVYGRIGTHTTQFGSLASWLVDLANLVSGNLDTVGGAMFPKPAHGGPDKDQPGGRGFTVGRWTSRVSGHPEVRGEFPSAAIAEEIETPGDGQIRGFISIAGNPALSAPNSNRLNAAFESLEFMVSVDIYLNESARHADVVLPAPSPLAKPHVDLAFYGLSVRNVFNYSEPFHDVDDPSQQGMDEHEIYARLALAASGIADGDPEQIYGLILATLAGRAGADPEVELERLADLPIAERVIDLMVRYGPYPDLDIETLKANRHGIDLGALEPRLPNLLKTPSGTIEAGAQPLVDDVARLAADLETPDTGLVLVGRRHLRSNNSWMHNISQLTKGKERCTVLIHPIDAAELELTDDTDVVVQSAAGAVNAPIEITDAVAVGTVSLPHGWGHDHSGVQLSNAAKRPGVNSNILTDEAVIDPLSGNVALNAIPVTVARSQ